MGSCWCRGLGWQTRTRLVGPQPARCKDVLGCELGPAAEAPPTSHPGWLGTAAGGGGPGSPAGGTCCGELASDWSPRLERTGQPTTQAGFWGVGKSLCLPVCSQLDVLPLVCPGRHTPWLTYTPPQPSLCTQTPQTQVPGGFLSLGFLLLIPCTAPVISLCLTAHTVHGGQGTT